MKRLLFAFAGVVVLLVLVIVFTAPAGYHTHLDEPLEITARLLDGETGEPVEDAVVLVVLTAEFLNEAWWPDLREQALELGEEAWMDPVVGRRVSGRSRITIPSHVCVTRHRRWVFTIRETLSLPNLLVIERQGMEREIVAIPQHPTLEPGDEPDTWKLDLGTVRVGQGDPR